MRMKDINLVIGNNIKELRKANKLTQNDLAEKLNYSNKAISRWESGEVIPDVNTLNNICELFNIPISQMFEEKIEHKPINTKKDYKLNTKLAITLLSILMVWLAATTLYVTLLLTKNIYFWKVFILAIPLSCVVGIIFNAIWGKTNIMFMLITVLIWSTMVSIYILLLKYNIWPIFFIGIPLQIGIMLWANISVNLKQKKLKAKLIENEKINNDN